MPLRLNEANLQRDFNRGPERVFDVAIVGAGMAGLTAAQTLSAVGKDVVVVEQSAEPGGRLATEPLGNGLADTGAQFFTVRSADFAEQVDFWTGEDLVYEWSRGWSGGSLDTAPVDGYPRYAADGGFRELAQQMAEGLELYLDEAVTAVRLVNGQWEIATTSGGLSAKALLLTPPVPLSLALLDRGQVVSRSADRAALEQIAYAPCLCGVFVLDGDVNLPEPGALQRREHPISWIADNQRKGISPHARVLTVHAGPEASQERWDMADRDALVWLADALRPFLHPSTNIIGRKLVRWPYALPTQLHPEPCLLVEAAAPLVFAGDAFGEARVEGAYLSGLAAAAALAS